MGQETVYCFKCQVKLTSKDFDDGRACRIGNRSSCSKCALDLMPKDAPRSTRHAARRTKPQPEEPAPKPSSSPNRRWVLPAVGGGGIVVAAVLAIILSMGGEEEKPEAATISKTPQPAAKPPKKQKASEPERLITEARSIPDEKLDLKIAAYEKAVRNAALTPHFQEFKAEYDALVEKRLNLFTEAMAKLNQDASSLQSKEEYGKAEGLYRSALERFAGEDWKRLIIGKQRERYLGSSWEYDELTFQLEVDSGCLGLS